jgi:hypothetical protein
MICCPDFFDAISLHLDVPTALVVACTSKAANHLINERIPIVLHADDKSWLSQMARAYGDGTTPTLQQMQTMHQKLMNRDYSDLKKVFVATDLGLNLDFQDWFYDRYVFTPDAQLSDLEIATMSVLQCVLAVFETIKDHETKARSFTSSIRLVSRLIMWTIEEDAYKPEHSIQPKFINHSHFMRVLLDRTAYFLDHADVIKDKQLQREFVAEVRHHKKFVLAWVHKLHWTGMQLYMGPNGGIYTLKPNGAKKYFRA